MAPLIRNLDIRWKSSSFSSSSSSMELQSHADFPLHNGLLPVSSGFWPLFPIRNFALTNICTVYNSTNYAEMIMGRDSSVGIATRFGIDGPAIKSRWGGGARFSAPVQTGPGAHPASCAIGTGSLLGVKRPGRGVDHPPNLAPRLKKE